MADERRDTTTDGGVPVETEVGQPLGVPRWVTAVLPIVLLVLVLGAFVFTSPLGDTER